MLGLCPPRSLDSILREMGSVGQLLAELQAAEGAAGNLSVYLGRGVPAPTEFSGSERVDLPLAVPGLAGGTLLVTGSGQRIRDLAELPEGGLGCLRIDAGGRQATLHFAPRRRYARLTSELNSHLAVHADQLAGDPDGLLALVHAQPRHVTYLSHLDAYGSSQELSRRLLRWQPESILTFPHGVAVAPFRVPGSERLMAETVSGLRSHPVVVWRKHGLMARSNRSLREAADLVEYLEAAAHYEFLNLSLGERAVGLTPEEVRSLAAEWGVTQSVY